MAENYSAASSGFIGSYRAIYITNDYFTVVKVPLLCDTFNENMSLAANEINTFDGKGTSALRSIGNFSQGFSVNNCPVLIGSHPEYYDARDFTFHCFENLFPIESANGIDTLHKLPLLKTASLNITENDASMTFALQGDGIRAYGYGTRRELFYGNAPNNFLDFCSSPTRPAYSHDFIFAFGPYKAFVIDGSFTINHNIDEFSLCPQTHQDIIGQQWPLNPDDANRQYKVLVPHKLTIRATGRALVSIEDCVLNESFDTNYNKNSYEQLSLQDPGKLNLFKQYIMQNTSLIGNQFELYIQTSAGQYEKFFRKPGRMGLEVLSAYLTTQNLSVTTSDITVSFDCLMNAAVTLT